MYPQGHMALNLVLVTGCVSLAKVPFFNKSEKRFNIPVWPALIAAIFPDLIDKVVCDVFDWAPYGRNWTHNLTAAFFCSLVLGSIFHSWKIALSWMIGHIGHLIGDFVFIPWFYPWLEYNWPGQGQNIVQGVLHTVQDMGQGQKLRADAASIWQGKRLIAETLFFAGAGLSYYFIVKPFAPFQKNGFNNNFGNLTTFICIAFTLVIWIYIVIEWDLSPFINSWKHYGLA